MMHFLATHGILAGTSILGLYFLVAPLVIAARLKPRPLVSCRSCRLMFEADSMTGDEICDSCADLLPLNAEQAARMYRNMEREFMKDDISSAGYARNLITMLAARLEALADLDTNESSRKQTAVELATAREFLESSK